MFDYRKYGNDFHKLRQLEFSYSNTVTLADNTNENDIKRYFLGKILDDELKCDITISKFCILKNVFG